MERPHATAPRRAGPGRASAASVPLSRGLSGVRYVANTYSMAYAMFCLQGSDSTNVAGERPRSVSLCGVISWSG